jgi:hypothetical protein
VQLLQPVCLPEVVELPQLEALLPEPVAPRVRVQAWQAEDC